MSDALQRLELELRAAVRRGAPQPALLAASRRRRPQRRSLAAALALLGALVVASGAFGVSALLDAGKPVGYRFGAPVAGVGLGVPLPGTVRLLPQRVADPVGGPPWGLRVFHTSRGFGCLQVGRVVDGQLGVLGQDGAFHDDGRFHLLRPGVILDANECVPLDASGHPRLAIHIANFPASGIASCVPAGGGCPRGALRSLDLGFAGPQATAVVYRTSRGGRTVSTGGPDGAYLIVGAGAAEVAPTPRGAPDTSGSIPEAITRSPASAVIVRVDFRNGTSCVAHPSEGQANGCERHGPAPVNVTLPPTAAVRTILHARLTAQGSALELHASFRARVAVVSERSGYTLTVEMPDRHRTGHGPCGNAITLDLDRNVAAGQTVNYRTAVARCRGTYRLELRYRVQPPLPNPGGTSNLAYPGRLAATATVAAPR